MIGIMFKSLIIFGSGVYTGIYVAQNYEIEKVDDPKTLLVKAQDYAKGLTEGNKDCADKKK